MTRIAPFVMLTVLTGCLDTSIEGRNVGLSTASGTSGSGSNATSTGSGGSPEGSTGSGSGGSTTGGIEGGTGGSATGGTGLLSQMCTDYVNGALHVDQCAGGTGPFATIQQCEAALAVCTTQDDEILDAAGLCLQGVPCDSTNLEASVLSCVGDIFQVSAACLAAASGGAGGQPP